MQECEYLSCPMNNLRLLCIVISQDIKCARSLPIRTGFSSTKKMGRFFSPHVSNVRGTRSVLFRHVIQISSVLYLDRSQLDVVDVLEGQIHTISLPITLKAVFLVAEDRWLLVENQTDR